MRRARGVRRQRMPAPLRMSPTNPHHSASRVGTFTPATMVTCSPRRSVRSRPTDSASTTCSATYSNGSKTAGMSALRNARPRTARPGSALDAAKERCAAAPWFTTPAFVRVAYRNRLEARLSQQQCGFSRSEGHEANEARGCGFARIALVPHWSSLCGLRCAPANDRPCAHRSCAHWCARDARIVRAILFRPRSVPSRRSTPRRRASRVLILPRSGSPRSSRSKRRTPRRISV